jgi:hypothetical protein
MTPCSLHRSTELAEKPTASLIRGDNTDDAVNKFRRNSYIYLPEFGVVFQQTVTFLVTISRASHVMSLC